MGMKRVVACYKVLSRTVPGRAEKNLEDFDSVLYWGGFKLSPLGTWATVPAPDDDDDFEALLRWNEN
jgi:hypothetical protein